VHGARGRTLGLPPTPPPAARPSRTAGPARRPERPPPARRPTRHARAVSAWLGAPERPFQKYAQLWRDRLGAAAVLQARPNPAALILPAYGELASRADAAALAGAAAADPGAPVFLHLFSGGGFLYSGLLLRALQRQGSLAALTPRVAGVVLDSSPAFVTADVSARALLAAALREPAAGVEDRHPRALSALRGAVDAYLSLGVTRRRIADMEASWHALVPPCPKLYLYSESDALVSPGTIQGHMQSEAVRGSRVYAHKWADTPHVEHYRLHPEQYTAIVARFVEESLAGLPRRAPEASEEGSLDSDGSAPWRAGSSSSGLSSSGGSLSGASSRSLSSGGSGLQGDGKGGQGDGVGAGAGGVRRDGTMW
jgi:hypothetical protein